MNKDFIFRIINEEKLSQPLSIEDKDGGIFCNYTKNITAQIVQAQTEQEMRVVCSEINQYIRANGIDICYVVDENTLLDLLQEHNVLKQQLYSVEEQNKRVLEKLEIITNYNQELETRLGEQSRQEIIIAARQGGKAQMIKIKLKQIQNEKAVEELRKVKSEFCMPHLNGSGQKTVSLNKLQKIINRQIKNLLEGKDE